MLAISEHIADTVLVINGDDTSEGNKIMRTYYATIKHDNGIITLIVHARNKQQAIRAICEVEGCPESAITEITN